MIEGTGTRLRVLRVQRKLTMKQVAERTGIDDSTISSYENEYTAPSGENARKLAVFFNTTTDFILCMDDSEPIMLPNHLSSNQKTTIRNIVDSALELIEQRDENS